MPTVRTRHLIAVLALDLLRGQEIQILPDGQFTARDGRPGKGRAWRLDAQIAQDLIAKAASRRTALAIDYEHQTLHAAANGQPAPAAGWFKTLEYRPGQGLYATDVEWTERASTMIAAGEYRYLSPVFSYDPSGKPLEVLNVALTNSPALDELDEVQLKAAASMAFTESQEIPPMDPIRKAVLAALGLAETATEEQTIAALSALQTKAGEVDGLRTEVAALKTQAPDPAKVVPLAVHNELKTEVAALRTSLDAREVEDLIAAALTEGKLATQGEQAYAREVGKASIASLKAYIAATPAIDALRRPQSGGTAPTGGPAKGGELTEAELAVCRTMNLDPAKFKETRDAAR